MSYDNAHAASALFALASHETDPKKRKIAEESLKRTGVKAPRSLITARQIATYEAAKSAAYLVHNEPRLNPGIKRSGGTRACSAGGTYMPFETASEDDDAPREEMAEATAEAIAEPVAALSDAPFDENNDLSAAAEPPPDDRAHAIAEEEEDRSHGLRLRQPGEQRPASKQGWTAWEDTEIARLYNELGSRWSLIASRIPGRTDDAVRNRFIRLRRKLQEKADSDDGKTTSACLNDAIAASVVISAMDESAKKPKAGVNMYNKKGDMWTQSEDEAILTAVNAHGYKWGRIGAKLPGRSVNAVRNRYLRLANLGSHGMGPLPIRPLPAPGGAGEAVATSVASEGGTSIMDEYKKAAGVALSIKKGDMWTEAEDEAILAAVNLHGYKWHRIGAGLPGRSVNAVRNRFLRLHSLGGKRKGKDWQPDGPGEAAFNVELEGESAAERAAALTTARPVAPPGKVILALPRLPPKVRAKRPPGPLRAASSQEPPMHSSESPTLLGEPAEIAIEPPKPPQPSTVTKPSFIPQLEIPTGPPPEGAERVLSLHQRRHLKSKAA